MCDNRAIPASMRHLSLTLQKLPTQYHWVFADEALLRAISRGEPMVRGILGRRLRGLVKICQPFGALWPLLCVVGLVELGKLLRQQQVSSGRASRQAADYPSRFFVGFGAGAEEPLFKEYSENHGGKVGKLDQIDVRSFAVWHKVNPIDGLGSFWRALQIARMALAEIPPALKPWRIDFMTYVGMRLGYYAYMSSWFEILKSKMDAMDAHVEEVAFLAADTAAFAAVAGRIPTCYHQHGLIYYSIQPNFTRVDALTADEAAYLRIALPEAQITVRQKQELPLAPAEMMREVLITSAFYGDHPNMSLIETFLVWASSMGVPVKVRPRPHPHENSTFWSSHAASGAVAIESQDPSFRQALERLKPRIVVSWPSTTLVDALGYGFVPVLVCEEGDHDVEEMAYSLFRRCLRWPRDCQSIARLLHDDEYYVTVLKQLRDGFSEAGI